MLGSLISETLIAIGAGVLAMFGWWWNNRRIAKNSKAEGIAEAEERSRRLDHENAAAIRDRARAARNVRKGDDTRGYRD